MRRRPSTANIFLAQMRRVFHVQRRGLSAEMIMSDLEFGLKIYALWFVGMFLLGIAINLLTKKEHRQSLSKLAIDHVRMSSAITIVGLIVCAMGWFLFKVV